MKFVATVSLAGELKPGDHFVLDTSNHETEKLRWGHAVWIRNEEPLSDKESRLVCYRLEIHDE